MTPRQIAEIYSRICGVPLTIGDQYFWDATAKAFLRTVLYHGCRVGFYKIPTADDGGNIGDDVEDIGNQASRLLESVWRGGQC